MADVVLGTGTGTFLAAQDVLARQDIPILFRKKGYNRMPFFMELFVLGMGGGKEGRAENQNTFWHHEDTKFKELLQLETNFAGAAAGVVGTMRVKQSLITNSTIPFRVNDNLLFTGGVTGQITSIIVNSATNIEITVRPQEITDALPAVVAATGFISVIGNAKSRGSNQPAPLQTKTEPFSHTFQIIADSTKIEGSLISERIWVTQDSSGRAINGWWSKTMFDAEYRQYCNISDALLFQKLTTNGNVDPNNSNAAITTTEGFFPWLEVEGAVYPVSGSVAVANFNTATRYLDTQRAGSFVYAKMGIDLFLEVEDVLVTYFDNSNIAAVIEAANSMVPGVRELHGTSTFKGFTKGGTNYLFSKFEELSDDETYAYTASDYTQYGAFFPIGSAKDPVTKLIDPIIGYAYKSGNGYNRHMEMWQSGAAGGQAQFQYVGENDSNNYYLRSEIASDYKLGNKCILWRPS